MVSTGGVIFMEKTATLNLRVNPIVKERAEEVLSRLGVPIPDMETRGKHVAFGGIR